MPHNTTPVDDNPVLWRWVCPYHAHIMPISGPYQVSDETGYHIVVKEREMLYLIYVPQEKITFDPLHISTHNSFACYHFD